MRIRRNVTKCFDSQDCAQPVPHSNAWSSKQLEYAPPALSSTWGVRNLGTQLSCRSSSYTMSRTSAVQLGYHHANRAKSASKLDVKRKLCTTLRCLDNRVHMIQHVSSTQHRTIGINIIFVRVLVYGTLHFLEQCAVLGNNERIGTPVPINTQRHIQCDRSAIRASGSRFSCNAAIRTLCAYAPRAVFPQREDRQRCSCGQPISQKTIHVR